jgi:hypothetical protein
MRGGRCLSGLALLVGVSAGCSHQTQPDCVMTPCPAPLAIVMNVTSAAGGPVPGLTLTFSGSASGSGQCSAGQSSTLCVVVGMPGSYNLQLTAPGVQAKIISATVVGITPACGCTSVQTQQLNVVLTPE